MQLLRLHIQLLPRAWTFRGFLVDINWRTPFSGGWYRCRFATFLATINPLKPNDTYRGRTAPLTSKRCILYTYTTNICTGYFKHGTYSQFFPLQNPVCFIKVKAVPLQVWTDPEGSRKLRFPDFVTTPQDGDKVVSLTHRPPLPPRKYSWYSFMLEAESTPGP